jgi:hypothetical protein
MEGSSMCIRLLQEANAICEALGEEHWLCKRARRRVDLCERAREGRLSDTTADDRLMAFLALQEEIYAALFEKIDPDRVKPIPCGMASVELRAKLFADEQRAMVFSHKLAEAFTDAKLELKDNETFTCLICVTEKPKSVTEALALDPLGVSRRTSLPVNYVMEPTVMKSVMKRIEKDKIHYGSERPKTP